MAEGPRLSCPPLSCSRFTALKAPFISSSDAGCGRRPQSHESEVLHPGPVPGERFPTLCLPPISACTACKALRSASHASFPLPLSSPRSDDPVEPPRRGLMTSGHTACQQHRSGCRPQGGPEIATHPCVAFSQRDGVGGVGGEFIPPRLMGHIETDPLRFKCPHFEKKLCILSYFKFA